jgi:hypothetical protein
MLRAKLVIVMVASIGTMGMFASATLAQSPIAPELGSQVTDGIDQLQGAVEAGGIPANRDPVECGALCTGMVDAEQAAGDVASPAANRLAFEEWSLRARLWLLPAADAFPPGEVVVGTGILGYAVGTGIRKLFVHAPAPPHVQDVSDTYVWVWPQQVVYGVTMPGMGVVPAVNGAPQLWEDWTTNCNNNPSQMALPPNGLGAFTPVYDTIACPWGGAGSFSYIVGWHGEKLSAPAVLQPSDPVSGTVAWPSYDALVANPTAANVRQWLIDQLDDDPDKYPTLIALANYVFGVPGAQDPLSDRFNMPDCTNFSAADCATWIGQLATNSDNTDDPDYEAGVATHLSTQVLDSDQAVMERAADAETATYPDAGTAVAPDDVLTIYKNPSTMPTMTAQEEDIADTLEDQNPDTVDETNKKTIARTCVKLVTDALRSVSDCTGLPILVVGSDLHTPALTAAQGILRNHTWVALNARNASGLSRTRWYANLGTPEPGCLDDERPLTSSCDEYPMWATLQAYGGTLNTLTPSIRWAPQKEQDRQGAVIRQFYSNNNTGTSPTSFTFHGCDITKQAPTDILPALDSTYLVLPLPFDRLLPSTGICNKPTGP